MKGKLILPAAALSAAALARMYYEERHFTTEYYEIRSARIPEAFDGFRFVMVSDLHNYDFDCGNQRLLKAMEALMPSAVIAAGDMINAQPGADMSAGIRFMQDICDRWPVYLGYGNHEQRLQLYPDTYGDMYRRWSAGIAHEHLHLLRNGCADICCGPDRLRIYGLEMDRIYYKRFRQTPMKRSYLTEKLGACDHGEYNILIAHNPLYFEAYAAWGADLVLSGHVHGGVVILPVVGGVLSPQVTLFPRYYAGLYQSGDSQMILSRGLHMHSIRIRLFNRPELSCVTLRRIRGGT